jgi:hypothetical protein
MGTSAGVCVNDGETLLMGVPVLEEHEGVPAPVGRPASWVNSRVQR